MSFNPVPKPKFKRYKPTRGQKSKITQSVSDEVIRRAGGKRCERCGTTSAYSYERAHLIQASQGGRGDDPANIALLCGPSVNTGTCHNIADYTAKGREWREKKRIELIEYYNANPFIFDRSEFEDDDKVIKERAEQVKEKIVIKEGVTERKISEAVEEIKKEIKSIPLPIKKKEKINKLLDEIVVSDQL